MVNIFFFSLSAVTWNKCTGRRLYTKESSLKILEVSYPLPRHECFCQCTMSSFTSLTKYEISFIFFFSYWMKPNVIFCRNKMRKTPVQMAERRGVSFEVLHHLRKLAELEDCDNVVVTNTSERNYYGQTIFMDFCNSVGLKVFTLVILVLLVCSLYVAYMITGFASTEKRILIDSTSSRIEL